MFCLVVKIRSLIISTSSIKLSFTFQHSRNSPRKLLPEAIDNLITKLTGMLSSQAPWPSLISLTVVLTSTLLSMNYTKDFPPSSLQP